MTVLTERALVLNKGWVPISTITLKGALILLFRGKASVICPETYSAFDIEGWIEASKDVEDGIKSVNLSIAKPEVILLKEFSRVPNRKLSFTRRNIYKRDKYICQYCYKKMPNGKLTIDHVIPRSKGGENSWENCVLACVSCNSRKGSKSLKQMNFKLLKEPKKPLWSPVVELNHATPDSWKKFLPV